MAAVQPSMPAPATGPGSTTSATASDDAKDAASRSGSSDMPVRTKESFDRLMVERYTMRDSIAASALSQQLNQTMKSSHEMREMINEYRSVRNAYQQWFPPSKLYGEGYNGYANGRKDMLKQAEQHEDLVPLRLDVEWDKIKLRDTFTWNLHERLLAVELFAAQLVEDMGLKPPASQPVYEQVVLQMREQLNDFYPFAYSEEDALDPELPYSAYKNDEMRILVKLNITIGQHTLVDQFEWEINNPSNSPEEFAAGMTRDLSLSGEFTTAIAHCIREQSQLFTKSLYSIGHPFDGRPVEDSDLVSAFLQTPLPTVFRPQQQAKEYAPYLYEMSEADLERNETVFSRDQRRQKRSINRRGGPQLPDLKDRQRTIRTLIVSSVLPGAAANIEESRLYKKVAGPTRKRVARDGEISESEESEDSAPDSPAPSNMAGTARTRNMRGAASAAQQRMANLGRSETPDIASHHHETRTSRRFREETEDRTELVVTLRVNREKLKRIIRGDYRDLATSSVPPETPSSTSNIRTPTFTAPPKPKALTPVPTPAPAGSTPQPAAAGTGAVPPGQIGRLPAPPLIPGQSPPPAPPPPEWLVQSLKELEKQYPNGDRFEAIMKYSHLDPVTELPIQTQPMPEGVKYAWLPRIRCLDCTTKLYTPGPDMTAQKFEAHLRFSGHREKVRARLAHQGAGASSSTS
ncbi:hypothetical protein TrVGV298_008743 [Trichoderma virens]|nr:hypothetical protein TrVGV298_008743 [Trichoderma virens]